MGFAANIDLGSRSDQVRRDYVSQLWVELTKLIPSSGWIGDIVIPFSNLTGIWDTLLLSVLFIVSWMGIRMSDRVVALVLARGFDTTIPLQHYLSTDAEVQQLHSAHCSRYWQIWYFGTAVEAAAYFLFHPDLFTLVTCFKTTVMVLVWHGRNADGTFWTSGVKLATTPSPGAPAAVEHISRDEHKAKKQKQYNDFLEKKKFDEVARKEMLKELNGKSSSNDRQALLTKWGKANAQEVKSLNDEYGKRGKDETGR